MLFTMSSCQKESIDIFDDTGRNHLKYIGADVSLLTRFEQNRAIYKNEKGEDINLLPYLKQNGFNYVRYRLFVNPDSNPDTCQDLDYVISLCKRSKSVGLKILLDFHYSDTWADPGKQTKPTAWINLSEQELNTKIYDYTKSTLQRMQVAGVLPDMIQTGNEISSGMLWDEGRVSVWNDQWNTPNRWSSFTNLLKSATKACRDIAGRKVPIMIHTERSCDAAASDAYYTKLKEYNVDYDIIGLSYYPFWHGTITQMENTLKVLTHFYDKKIIFAEIAYPYKDYGYPTSSNYPKEYPSTPAGQTQFVRTFIDTIQKYPNVEGLFYWDAEETFSPNEITPFKMHLGLFDNETGKVLPAFKEFGLIQK